MSMDNVGKILDKGASEKPHRPIASSIMKLIQELGKPVYTNKRKIRENKPSSLLFLTYRD